MPTAFHVCVAGSAVNLTAAGHPIQDPMLSWRKYASQHWRTLQRYDLQDQGDPNRITADDIRRTRIIGSRISNRQCDELINRAGEARCPWQSVAENANLADADPALRGGLFDHAADLYWYFTVPLLPGVRVAKVHKTLHIKRPNLYPILDTTLKRVYRDQARPWVEKLSRMEVTIRDSPPYWAAIRQDLLDNEAALEAYVRQLADDPDETVSQMAAISKLRLLDILAWSL